MNAAFLCLLRMIVIAVAIFIFIHFDMDSAMIIIFKVRRKRCGQDVDIAVLRVIAKRIEGGEENEEQWT